MNWVVAPSKDIVCKVGRAAVVARYNAEIVRDLSDTTRSRLA